MIIETILTMLKQELVALAVVVLETNLEAVLRKGGSGPEETKVSMDPLKTHFNAMVSQDEIISQVTTQTSRPPQSQTSEHRKKHVTSRPKPC